MPALYLICINSEKGPPPLNFREIENAEISRKKNNAKLVQPKKITIAHGNRI